MYTFQIIAHFQFHIMIMNLTILFSLFIFLQIFIKHILLTEPIPKTEMGQADQESIHIEFALL